MPDRKKIVEITDPALLEGDVITPSVNIDSPKLAQDIADIESAGGDYHAVNKHTGALGKYQFVPSYFWKDIQEKTGVKTKKEFLDSPEKQEQFFQYHTNNNLIPAVEKLRAVNKRGYSDSQLARLIHFKGEGGAHDYLARGVDATTANNVSIPSYIGEPEGQSLSTQSPASSLREISDADIEGGELMLDNNQDPAPSTVAPQAIGSQQDVLTGLFGKNIEGQPMVSNQTIQAAKGDLWSKDKTKYAADVLEKNKHLDWVQRLFDPNAPDIKVPGEKYNSTHLMSDNGEGYVFPTIVRNKKGELINLGDRAEDYARETNTGIQLPKEQGSWFAANGYKTAKGVINDITEGGKHINNPNFGKQLIGQEINESIFGKNVSGEPIVSDQTILAANATPSHAERTKSAIDVLAKDFIDNQQTHPEPIKSAFQNTELAHGENPLNQVTNPAGDPTLTAQYFKDRKSQLLQEMQQQINAEKFTNPAVQVNLPIEYNKKIKDLEEAAKHLTSIQIFQKEYANKPLTDALKTTKLDALEKQRKSEIAAANRQMHETMQPLGMNKADDQRRDRIAEINRNYQAAVGKVNSESKWDGVRLGIEQKRLLGDKQAEQDAINYDSGKPISPERKYQYQVVGNDIKKSGLEGAKEAGVHSMVNDAQTHVETDEKIENDNIDYFKNKWANEIGNEKYKEENPLLKTLHTVIPSGSLSAAELKEYGKKVGLSDAQINKVDREEVPTTATLWQQFTKGALNTAAPIYEQSMRGIGALAGADHEAINDHFQPGWENQRGLGAAIVGNIPTEQNSFHNVRGALGQIFEGAGGLSTFAGEVGGVSKGLEGLGLASDAAKAEKMANFGVMAFSGYNNAYHDANEVIGDKPEDEWKRQAFALASGIIEGKVFSISPQSQLVKRALGVEEKTGQQLLNDIKKANGIEELQTPEFKSNLAKYATEIAKENGTQVSLAVGNEMAQTALKIILDPGRKQNIPEEVKNTAISTALAMAIPSIMGGIGHVNSHTPLNKAAMFEVGSNPKKYTEFVNNQLAEGKINERDASVMREGVGVMQSAISHTPTETIEGKLLTPDQVKDYSYNLFQEQLLQKKAEALNKGASLAQIPVDKAQLEPLNKRISELQGQRTKILEDAGTLRPTASLPEEKIEDNGQSIAPTREEAEKAIQDRWDAELEATKDMPDIEADKKAEEINARYEKELADLGEKLGDVTKTEEKVAQSEKEDISLSSEIKTQKTTENEINASKQIEDGGQISSEDSQAEGRRENSEVRSATSGELPREQEDRKLSEADQAKENELKAAPETEQPLVVKEKRKRKKLVAEEDVTTEPATEEKPIEDAGTQSKEQQQESIPEGGESEHARTEQVIGETAPAEAENSDSAERGPQEEVAAVESFETEKGSVYEYGKDGKTTRLKAVTGEHQEPQDLTVFAKFNDEDQNQRFLQGIQNREGSGTKVYVIDKEGNVYDRNEDVSGKDVRLALIDTKTGNVLETAETKTVPTKGYNTFDQRRFTKDGESFRESHIGNKVAKIKIKEEKNSEPSDERSVATDAESETPTSAAKEPTHEERIKTIDDNISKEKQSLKDQVEKGKLAEKERQKTVRSGTNKEIAKATEEVNKRKDFALKKQDKIARLEEERTKAIAEQKDQVIKSRYNDFADRIEQTYAKNKERHKGVAYSSIAGINPKIVDPIVDFIVAKTVSGLRNAGNLHVSLRAAIREAKANHPEIANEISERDERLLYQHLEHLKPIVHEEPVLPIDHEEYAKDVLSDIQKGIITYEEAVQDIHDEVIESREGKPLSDNVQDKNKAKILNYIDWHNHDIDEKNSELVEPEHKNSILRDYKMKQSDAWSRMISGDTITKRTGDAPLNPQEVIKYDLELSLQDTQKMVGYMKEQFGTDILDWAPKMLAQVDHIDPADTPKRIAALIGLMDELRKDRGIYEYELTQLTDSPKDVLRRKEVNNYLSEIPKLLKAAEVPYQLTLRNASKTLNGARNMSKLFSGEYAKHVFADESTLSKKQSESKEEFVDKIKKKTSDKILKEGVIKEREEADKEIEQAAKQVDKKAKSSTERLRETGAKKNKKDKVALDKIAQEAEEQLKRKGLTPENMFNKIKELIKKNPC